MRKKKRYANFALAVCMGASLLVNAPAGTALASETGEVITSVDDSTTEGIVTSEDENPVEEATGTDAEALDEAQETVYYSADEADADGFVWEETKIIEYIGKGGNVKIPAKCTSIGSEVFEDCSNLTSIEIPAGVTKIGMRAFSGCSGLKNIEIPASVTEIDYGAFKNCTGFTSIEIPAGVTKIGGYILSGCTSLRSITVSSQNTAYNSNGNCNAIIETKTNTLIQGCRNTVIPASVTGIGYCAFNKCTGLTSIEIPSGVTSIGDNAFSYCSDLTSIKIPAGVTSIGSEAFSDCSGLTSIIVSPENKTYNSNGGCNAIIETKTNTLIQGCRNTVIPAGVTSIEDRAFSGCSSLTNINIPASVTKIGDWVFQDCTGLRSITVSPENKTYNSNGNCNAIIKTQTNTLIQGCRNTVIPTGVTGIGSDAFENCRGLTSIEIPEGVTWIGYGAFSFCSDLTSIKIPASVTSIGNWAFGYCGSLTRIVVSPKNTTYNSNGDCNAIIETATNELIQGCRNTVIPAGVKSIGEGAFSGCKSLTCIVIPADIIRIMDYAFDESGLKTIYGTSGSYAETYAKKNGYQFAKVTVPTVTNVRAAAAGKNKVKVTWDKVSGATGYIVYARKNGKYAKLGVTAATNYTDTKALDNNYNFYFVYAYKKIATGNIFTGKCQKYAYAKGTCKAVTNLKASSIKGGVKLTWTKSVGADGYIIYGKHPGGTYGYVGMTSKNTATSFTDKGADKKNYNFYWVFPYHNKNGKRVIGPICGYVYGKAK